MPGYQCELTYKHDDGSYSALGKSDATDNTWLTAFVVKCFGQARPYIFIDQQHIEDALKWLQQHQMESGCFQSVGKLLNNALQGSSWLEGAVSQQDSALSLSPFYTVSENISLAIPGNIVAGSERAHVTVLGNTWLTAFVVKCFGQARPYIFIDQQHIEDALKWLQQHQMESGCFQSVGKLLNNALQV
ncbi:alpha-2-macroglobulin-like protein 1 [Alligator mississippiensis]|uniref:Alpha-2-macroglobulin-like protein 1 n=1 Tax=Alligator mississippiensis TaxID=8496 RepID=A0A151N5X8_ALLMI|nr:alpha-2-macroglobulin-like protein 1 [Alligator mississippiensis]